MKTRHHLQALFCCFLAIFTSSCATFSYNNTEDILVGKLSGEVLGQLVSWEMSPETTSYDSNGTFYTEAYKDLEQLKVSFAAYGDGEVMNNELLQITSIETELQHVQAIQKKNNKLTPKYCEYVHGELKIYFEVLADFESTLKNGSSPDRTKSSTTSAATGN